MRAQNHKVNRRRDFIQALRDTFIVCVDSYIGGHTTKHTGNAMASEGMGQRPGIGACAAEKLILSRLFSDTIDSRL